MEQIIDTSDALRLLEEIAPSERLRVGEKALRLSELHQQGFPVVPGIVVTDSVLRHFLTTLEGLEPFFSDFPNSALRFNVSNFRELQAIAQRIRNAIQTTSIHPSLIQALQAQATTWEASALILRPSLATPVELTAEMEQGIRGLLDSPVCWAEPEAIAQALRQVWGELFRARSLFYWQRSGLELHRLHLAVLVQPLRSPVAAGVACSDGKQAQVQAVWGLGHGLMSGAVAADVYVTAGEAIATPSLPTKQMAYQRVADRSTADAPPIVPHPLSPQQQQQPVLDAAQQAAVIQLVQQIAQQRQGIVEIEWMLSQSPDSEASHISITQLTSCATADSRCCLGMIKHAEPLSASALPRQLILRGIPASPGRVFGRLVHCSPTFSEPEQVRGQILVMPQVLPASLPLLRVAAGLITEQGGITSHGAILARELQVPAVVSLGRDIHQLQSGDVVALDGDRGTITPISLADLEAPATPNADSEAGPTSPLATHLFLTLSQPDALTAHAQTEADGIGLLRSEQLLLGTLGEAAMAQIAQANTDALTTFPETLADAIAPFLEAFAPRPVFYRSLDWRSPDYDNTLPHTNPLLGWHGTLRDTHFPDRLQAELQGLRRLQQSGLGNVRLILPFVRSVEEFAGCREVIRQAGLFDEPQFEVWIMAEVPSVLFQLPDFVQAGVQGIAIGSNDLTQLVLAIDRDQPDLANTYTPAHPAMQAALKHLIQTARRLGLPCTLCGEATVQHPDLIPALLRWGMTGFSVPPDALQSTRRAIARAEQHLLLEAARRVLDTP